jgi:hypothetical protein
MRVVGSGKLRAVVDDHGGVVQGLWVANTDFLSGASNEMLQAMLGHLETVSGVTIPPEKYQRFIERQFVVKRNDPRSGGGFFLMISESPTAQAASPGQIARSADDDVGAPKRVWWKFWS